MLNVNKNANEATRVASELSFVKVNNVCRGRKVPRCLECYLVSMY